MDQAHYLTRRERKEEERITRSQRKTNRERKADAISNLHPLQHQTHYTVPIVRFAWERACEVSLTISLVNSDCGASVSDKSEGHVHISHEHKTTSSPRHSGGEESISLLYVVVAL